MTQPPDPYGEQPPPGERPPGGPPPPGHSPPPWQPPAGQPPPYPPPQPGYNVMAILALVFAFVFAPLGIVFGHVARRQIGQSGEQGIGLATAGLILGYVFTGIALLACCGFLGLTILGAIAEM